MPPTEPSPKRQKLSPTEERPPVLATSPTSKQPAPGEASDTTGNRGSWYNRTWPRKAAPIAEVARESISSASTTAIETASVIKDKVKPSPARKSSLALALGKQTSNKSLPANATTTTDHAMQAQRKPSTVASVRSEAKSEAGNPTNAVPTTEISPTALSSDQQQTPEQGKDPPPPPIDGQEEQSANGQATITETNVPRSWMGWLARSDNAPADKPPARDDKSAVSEAISTPLPETPAPDAKSNRTESVDTNTEPQTKSRADASLRKSWLPIWNNAAASQSAPVIATSPTETNDHPNTAKAADQQSKNTKPIDDRKDSKMPDVKAAPGPDSKSGPASAKVADQSQESSKAPSIETSLPQPQNQPQSAQKPSAWVFWARPDRADVDSSKQNKPHEGEIAISHTTSQDRPKRASIDLSDTPKPVVEQKKDRPASLPDADTKVDVNKHKKQDSKASVKSITASTSKASAVAIESPRPSSPAPAKKLYEHQLLPRFHETLKLAENQSLWQRLSHLFYATQEPELRHLNLLKDPPRVKNALAIGVHGYFPAPLIRTVLGQPTGTSIKFADMAAKSIKKWTANHGYECQVETAALEGEGKIADRVDLLWKLLLNWIEKIRKADFVMVACHSQGVPVAMMLVAKLIHFGCLTTSRVGICAMAGVNMGPFPEFKSRWISGSAGELFEFSDSTSKVSKDYLAAVEDVLKFGVRLTYIGSIDDQLVSLESSIFAPVSHPHIYRAVSIDARVHAPSFLSHLVAFALKLRNLGVQDHGLIKELSGPLAGSLYSGEGHSRIYENEAVYDLAVCFALETTATPNVPMTQRNIVSSTGNPYILPFAMRGILEEDFVKEDLQGEVKELLRQFDEWRPTTKALKDVKFRLEGIRSKL